MIVREQAASPRSGFSGDVVDEVLQLLGRVHPDLDGTAKVHVQRPMDHAQSMATPVGQLTARIGAERHPARAHGVFLRGRRVVRLLALVGDGERYRSVWYGTTSLGPHQASQSSPAGIGCPGKLHSKCAGIVVADDRSESCRCGRCGSAPPLCGSPDVTVAVRRFEISVCISGRPESSRVLRGWYGSKAARHTCACRPGKHGCRAGNASAPAWHR